MSKPAVTNMTFIPAPTDGLDLISSPANIAPTAARQLDNYLVFDSGIRQIAPPTLVADLAGTSVGAMFPYYTDAGLSRLLVCAANKIYRWDSPTDSSGTEVQNATSISNDFWNPFFFNKRIFLFNGTNVPRIHDRGTGNTTDFTCTGPTSTTLIQGCGYKHRMYLVQKNTTSFWYGAVDAFAGTYTQYDLGTVFETSGNLFCVFSWAFNQGNGNEELFGAINTRGELLLFSGDYPTSPNWTLAVRATLPVFSSVADSRQPFVKVANDIYFITQRGLVPLSTVVSGALQAKPYYTTSRNIKDVVKLPVAPALDPDNPFLFAGSFENGLLSDLYALNYERGAWSKITFGSIAIDFISSMSMFAGYLFIGTGLNSKIYSINLQSTGYGSSALTYTWKTPFFDFGKDYQKHSKFLRVLGTDRGSAASFKNTASIATEFVDPTSPTTDTKTTTLSAANVNAMQELAPPGTGTRLSYCFSRAGVANEKNEIQGFVAAFEYGGIY